MNPLLGVRMRDRRVRVAARTAALHILRIGALNRAQVVVPGFPPGVPGAEAEHDRHVVLGRFLVHPWPELSTRWRSTGCRPKVCTVVMAGQRSRATTFPHRRPSSTHLHPPNEPGFAGTP